MENIKCIVNIPIPQMTVVITETKKMSITIN